MAYKTLVESPSALVKQVVQYLLQMTGQKNEFSLAMLVPSEALSDKWNLVLSAPWIDREGLNAVIPKVTSALLRHLSRVNAKKLERVSILRTTDSLVSRMADLRIPAGEAYLVQNYPLTANGVGDAIILVAQRPAASRNYHSQTLQSRA
jgi:hypothetical protein